MAIQKQSYQIMGMRQDNLIGTNSSNKFAHEIMNLRLNTVGDYTTASWTTEEGTKLKPVTWDEATDQDALERLNGARDQGCVPIGQAVINDQWIVFCTRPNANPDERDIIFKYWYKVNTDDLYGTILYIGNLGFSVDHPIETLTYYENESIQKVYWTDGYNQPRVINIVNVKASHSLDTQFDFVQEVNLREQVEITKDTSGAGLFPPCTVKYAITYYNKYGQETNVVYDSPLYYPIKGERACGPEELSGDSFNIKVTGLDLDHGFDYIRLYSIVRTTEDATPTVRIVADKPLVDLPLDDSSKPYVLFVDTNTTGEIVDPTVLQYVGGRVITAETFSQKDNTLFLGNITLKTQSAKEVLDEKVSAGEDTTFLDLLRARVSPTVPVVQFSKNPPSLPHDTNIRRKVLGLRVDANGRDYNTYQYTNQMNETMVWNYGSNCFKKYNGNSQKIKIFKYREWYRFGIQFQDTHGVWSDVIFLDDSQNLETPYTDEWNPLCQMPLAYYKLKASIVEHLVRRNYVKARLVCCFENNADREILAQGVTCPTVYNNMYRNSHTPDVMASWFFRPNDRTAGFNWIPWQHNDPLMRQNFINSEIQSMDATSLDDNCQFKVDKTILTLHSPEIEFDESIRTLDLRGVNINIVGTIPVQSYASKYYVDAGSPMLTLAGRRGQGFVDGLYSTPLTKYNPSDSGPALVGSHAIYCGSYWDDRDVYYWDHARGWGHRMYPLYPFQRIGSLNNYLMDADLSVSTYSENKQGDIDFHLTQTAKLNSKVFASILYSGVGRYYNEVTPLNQASFEIFDSTETVPSKIQNSSGGSLIYYGNVNMIAPLPENDEPNQHKEDAHDDDKAVTLFGKYKIWVLQSEGSWNTMQPLPSVPIRYWSQGDKRDDENGEGGLASDPVPITFKSTPHGVFYTDKLISVENPSSGEYLTPNCIRVPYLWMVEVSRTTDGANRFGGPSNGNNIYLPCGPTVDLRKAGNAPYTDLILYGYEGDHYYMRYDCLKTYPFTTEDTNQIVEILSFMCETRINLDGRYDKNRGLLDNTSISTTNFNYINQSYTQSNNFFTFTILDELSASLDRFPNQLTWTKTKTSGEDVDAWTNITLASTADAEGTSGKINRIVNLNDSLYLFQDHGVAKIGYNEKTALSVENGVPLEIANSGKYTGLNYLSKDIGCQNKWSISTSKNGVFFIDDSRQELLTLSESLQSLSSQHGLDAFLIQQLPDSEHFSPWTPLDQRNFVTYYDKLGNDVFYINKDKCLAWNEQSKTFTSFYSYNGVPYMANIGTHLLMWDMNTPLVFDMAEGTREIETVNTRTETQYVDEQYQEMEPVLRQVTSRPGIFTDSRFLLAKWKTGPNLTPTTEWSDAHATIYKRRSRQDIKQMFARIVPCPIDYDNGNWDVHLIISLEFRKAGEPFIIQLEVIGTHLEPPGTMNNSWKTDPNPIVYYRVSDNVTEFDRSHIKFALGGYHEPTIQIGNLAFNGSSYVVNGQQPWAFVDNTYIDEDGDEVVCVVKIYEITANSETSIAYFVDQGMPFISGISDISNQYDSAQAAEDPVVYYETDYELVTKTRTVPVEVEVTETVKTLVPAYTIKSSTSNIWAARENPNHCQFFGAYKPYWITIACDGASQDNYVFPADKVFNVVEYRADVFNRRETVPRPDINLPVFDIIAAYNGYQIYKEFPINSIRKFEIWRAQLPRATYRDSNNNLYTNRDRIRNPFCYIKLGNTNGTSEDFPNTAPLPNRMILHDLAVYYDMK